MHLFEADKNMKATLDFLYAFCNDVKAIQNFYGSLLNLETSGDPEKGYLMVDIGVKLCFFKGDYELPVISEWAWQPGYKCGSGHILSWSIKMNEVDFKTATKNILGSNTKKYDEKPEWRKDAYWGLTVKDPMGNSVEIYSVPAEKPAVLEWL